MSLKIIKKIETNESDSKSKFYTWSTTKSRAYDLLSQANQLMTEKMEFNLGFPHANDFFQSVETVSCEYLQNATFRPGHSLTFLFLSQAWTELQKLKDNDPLKVTKVDLNSASGEALRKGENLMDTHGWEAYSTTVSFR